MASHASADPLILFGGPDRPDRLLRDALEARVASAPAGSRIDWATYYFRDRALARSLIAASKRGVKVRLIVEGKPRLRGANDAALALLAGDGLEGGLKVRSGSLGIRHLHSKAYVFSKPDVALIGSFNPSGDEPEDRRVVSSIGDQDRGYNLLLPITDRTIVAGLRAHIDRLFETEPRFSDRFAPAFNAPVEGKGLTAYLYPRRTTQIVEPAIRTLGPGDRVRAALSHLDSGALLAALLAAPPAGVAIDLVLHATARRVSHGVTARLARAGVKIARAGNDHDVPMHNKFLLIERGTERTAWLGSYNYTWSSRYLNDELLVRATDAKIFDALATRFDDIKRVARPFSPDQ